MIAIIVTIGNKYDCNRFQKGRHMIAIIKNLFTRDLSKNHSHKTLRWFSTLQSFFVPIETDCNHKVQFAIHIATIYGPLIKQDCNHGSPFFGPRHKNFCNYKWSSPISTKPEFARKVKKYFIKMSNRFWGKSAWRLLLPVVVKVFRHFREQKYYSKKPLVEI